MDRPEDFSEVHKFVKIFKYYLNAYVQVSSCVPVILNFLAQFYFVNLTLAQLDKGTYGRKVKSKVREGCSLSSGWKSFVYCWIGVAGMSAFSAFAFCKMHMHVSEDYVKVYHGRDIITKLTTISHAVSFPLFGVSVVACLALFPFKKTIIAVQTSMIKRWRIGKDKSNTEVHDLLLGLLNGIDEEGQLDRQSIRYIRQLQRTLKHREEVDKACSDSNFSRGNRGNERSQSIGWLSGDTIAPRVRFESDSHNNQRHFTSAFRAHPRTNNFQVPPYSSYQPSSTFTVPSFPNTDNSYRMDSLV